MTLKEKLLVLLIVVVVIGALVLTHAVGHLAFLLENCFAFVLPALRV